MPATARKFNITADDLANEGGGGGAWAEIETPSDHVLLCTDVNDYDKTDKGKGKGWLVDYELETPSGKTLEINVHISFSTAARWKLIQWAEAHELDLSEGVQHLDPNDAIDTEIGATIDFPRDKAGEATSKYREIVEMFSIAELENDSPVVSDAQDSSVVDPEVL